MFAQQIHYLRPGIVALLQRAFQEMRQEKPRALKLRLNRFGRLPFKGNPHGAKQLRCFSPEFPGWRVQKLLVLSRSHAAQQ